MLQREMLLLFVYIKVGVKEEIDVEGFYVVESMAEAF